MLKRFRNTRFWIKLRNVDVQCFLFGHEWLIPRSKEINSIGEGNSSTWMARVERMKEWKTGCSRIECRAGVDGIGASATVTRWNVEKYRSEQRRYDTIPFRYISPVASVTNDCISSWVTLASPTERNSNFARNRAMDTGKIPSTWRYSLSICQDLYGFLQIYHLPTER